MSASGKEGKLSESYLKALNEYSRLLEAFTKETLDYIVSLQKLWSDSMVKTAEIYGVSMKPFTGAEIFKVWTDMNAKLLSSWMEMARKTFEAFYTP